MTAPRRSWMAFLARLVVVVMVAVFAWPSFGEACCFRVQAALAEGVATGADCCPEPPSGEHSQDEQSHPCSCPPSCASGCSGIGRALSVPPPVQIAPPGSVAMARENTALAELGAPDPHDILHVPKRVAA